MTNTMILDRIQSYIYQIPRQNQNGFRSRRSITSHIRALRRQFEGIKCHNLKAIIIFVDFKKGCDIINRATMLYFGVYGIPKIIILTIALTNKDTFVKVTSLDGDT